MDRKIILVADKDRTTRKILKAFLESKGFRVLEAENSKQIRQLLAEDDPQLLLMDASMAEKNGLELCQELRQCSQIPIVFLSSANTIDEEIAALEAGADAYLGKPFDVRELEARVRAILRRVAEKSFKEGIIEYPLLHIDAKNRSVVAFGREIHITTTEQKLFSFLARNPNKAFSREELLNKVLGYDINCVSRTIDTHVKHLRKILEIPANSPWSIVTIRGVGYKFQLNRF